MASTNKNLIQSLRSAHDPHFKLEGRVEGLEKNIPIQIAQLHKTLSKSFGMQRKTLMRVLGLEKKLAELESSKQQSQEAEQEIEDVIDDVQDAVDEAGDVIDDEISGQLDGVDIPAKKEVGAGSGTGTGTGMGAGAGAGMGAGADAGMGAGADAGMGAGAGGASTAVKPKPKRKRLRIKKKKIRGADLKKGSSQETVEKIESRVSDNEKKIELVKNILKAQKSDLAEKLRSLEVESESESESEEKQISSPLLETLQAIAATTESIRDTLIQKQDNDKDIMEDIRVDQEKADADKQEKGLEKNAKPKPLAALGEKIAAPVVSLFGKIFNFLKTLFLGKFLMNFLDWFGNPENQGKIQSLIKFVGDYWPALTAAVLLFGTGFGGLVSGLLTSVAAFIPKMIAAVASMNPLLAIGLGTAAVVGGTALYMNNKKNKEDENQQEEPQKFNKGGQVPGSGNTDTVPAMLTPGEFVMSKSAVQQYGVNTMESMNAAAGGTNKPTYDGAVPEGASGYTGKEKEQQEAYMLHFVNQERALQGLPALKKLTYAKGVYLTKMRGPGPRINETSDTNMDFDKGIKTTSKTRTVDGKTSFAATIGQTTEEEKEQFFADNPLARTLVNLKNQAELDELGASISATAKMNGGGLVRGFGGGGVVQGFQGGGQVRGKSRMYNIKSKEPNNIMISYEQEANKDQEKSTPASGGNEIPSFDVAPIRDPLKMTTLQIVLF